MINLIPPSGYKTVRYEYYLRVASTIGMLFAGVFILLSVALIPMYVLLDAQINAFAIEQAQQMENEDAFTVADHEVNLAREMLAQLKRGEDTPAPSEIITEVRAVAPPNIIFTNFIMNTSDGAMDKIQIQGQAPTREALANFKTALESSPRFGLVELPIADLARDENLPFAISIELAQP